jgi:hypothetical protein
MRGKHSLNPYTAVGTGYRGELCVLRGDGALGVTLLTEALETLHAARYELVTTTLMIALAQGLAMTERWGEALEIVDETLGLVKTNGDLLYMPEVLRTRAVILARDGRGNIPGAEEELRRAIDLARRQSALSWELRAATSLATLWASQGRSDEAQTLLSPVYARFEEGFFTRDLRTAEALLASLAGETHLRPLRAVARAVTRCRHGSLNAETVSALMRATRCFTSSHFHAAEQRASKLRHEFGDYDARLRPCTSVPALGGAGPRHRSPRRVPGMPPRSRGELTRSILDTLWSSGPSITSASHLIPVSSAK